jgi:hypothetical protein
LLPNSTSPHSSSVVRGQCQMCPLDEIDL